MAPFQGWFAARLELKVPMIVFLVLSTLYLAGWGAMFDSPTFRWTFIQWGFFGAMAANSALLVLIGLIVGIMCRMNFGKGLVNYRKWTISFLRDFIAFTCSSQ